MAKKKRMPKAPKEAGIKIAPKQPDQLGVQITSAGNPYDTLQKEHGREAEPGIVTITGAGTIKKEKK